MFRPTNVYILWQSSLTGVRLSDHPETGQFNPLKMGLNVRCDNLTLGQSDPFSAPPGGGDSVDHDTQLALLKNDTAPPESTSPMHGSAGYKPNLA
jgi:hypothetical protein